MQENRENTGQVESKELNETELDKVSAGTGQNNLDSMSEMGEMESMKMQMTVDRMTKATQVQSIVNKKLSQTSSDIIQNIK